MIDRPALRELPPAPYEYADWKRCRVNLDYHVEIAKHFYSVPFRLLRERIGRAGRPGGAAAGAPLGSGQLGRLHSSDSSSTIATDGMCRSEPAVVSPLSAGL